MTTKELISYVEGELKKGEQKSAIKARLLQNGWSGEDIEEVFGVIENRVVGIRSVLTPIQNDSYAAQEQSQFKPKIKWKSGIILFLFLITISTIINSPIGGYLDFEDIEETIILGAIFALISSLVFIFSVNRTEKRVIKNEYRVKWIIKFNIILVLIIFVTVVLFLFTLGIGFLMGGDSDIFTLLPISILLFVFVFSVLPSLITYKFYNNQTAFKFVFIFSIILLLSLIGFRLISEYTCGFYVGPVCLGEKAVKKQNISLCEKIKEDPDDPPFFMRDLCYLAATDSGWKDISTCDKVYDSDLHSECIIKVADNVKNRQFCERIKNNEKTKECYAQFEEDE